MDDQPGVDRLLAGLFGIQRRHDLAHRYGAAQPPLATTRTQVEAG